MEFPDSENWNNVDLFRLSAGSYESGSYTIKFTAYKNSTSLSAILFNQENITTVYIPTLTDSSEITITGEVDNSKYLSLRLITKTLTKVYIDDVKLFKS